MEFGLNVPHISAELPRLPPDYIRISYDFHRISAKTRGFPPDHHLEHQTICMADYKRFQPMDWTFISVPVIIVLW